MLFKSEMNMKPLHELKGHKAPVVTLDYSAKNFIGEHVLASGSGFFSFQFSQQKGKLNFWV